VDTIEASGKTIEQAVLSALRQLGRRREDVDVFVIQEPSRGAFGLGAREARVRVTVRRPTGSGAVITPELADALLGAAEDSEEGTAYSPYVASLAPQAARATVPPAVGEEELYEDEELEDEDYLEDDEEEFDEDEEEYDLEEEEEPSLSAPRSAPIVARQPMAPAPVASGEAEAAAEQEIDPQQLAPMAAEVLQRILDYAGIQGSVQARSYDPLTLNVRTGDSLGLLIGRRGETLASLQLLVNLIIGHQLRHRVRIIVDVENYRLRREENLRSLAQRVAQQVRNYHRSITLEPMPPHERRIVHLALSDSHDVTTESIGEGDERRVVVSLKRPGR
jgi:spoIIIJ-associated protein